MRKPDSKQPLPKLEIRTLDHRELSKAAGGLPPRGGGSTNSTVCLCSAEDSEGCDPE